LLVRELMSTEVFTVEPGDPIDRVFFLLQYERIRHLPVIDRRRVIGMVSDRDLYKAIGPRTAGKAVSPSSDGTRLYVIPRQVRHIMRRGVVTVSPEAHVSEAAQLMARRKIGALPVVEDGVLVGIVTATDLLQALARLTRRQR